MINLKFSSFLFWLKEHGYIQVLKSQTFARMFFNVALLQPVYTKRQHQRCGNSAMMLAILFSLKTMESLQTSIISVIAALDVLVVSASGSEIFHLVKTSTHEVIHPVQSKLTSLKNSTDHKCHLARCKFRRNKYVQYCRGVDADAQSSFSQIIRNWQQCQYWHQRLYYVKKYSDKMLPPVGIEPGPLIPNLTLSFLHNLTCAA